MINNVSLTGIKDFEKCTINYVYVDEGINDFFTITVHIDVLQLETFNEDGSLDSSPPTFLEKSLQTYLYKLINIEFELKYGDAKSPIKEHKIYTGIVSDVKMELDKYYHEHYYPGSLRSHDPTVLVILTLKPIPWLLSLTNHYRAYVGTTVKDVASKIFTAFQTSGGFSDNFKVSFDATCVFLTRDNIVQMGESDLDFILRLMYEEGLCFSFAHTDTGHTLNIFPNIKSYLDDMSKAQGGGDSSKNKTDFFIRTKLTPSTFSHNPSIPPLFFNIRNESFMIATPKTGEKRAQEGTSIGFSLADYRHAMSDSIYSYCATGGDFRAYPTGVVAKVVDTTKANLRRSEGISDAASQSSSAWLESDKVDFQKSSTNLIGSSDYLVSRSKSELLKRIGLAHTVEAQTILFGLTIGLKVEPTIEDIEDIKNKYWVSSLTENCSYYVFNMKTYYTRFKCLSDFDIYGPGDKSAKTEEEKKGRVHPLAGIGVFFTNIKCFQTDDDVFIPYEKLFCPPPSFQYASAKVYAPPPPSPPPATPTPPKTIIDDKGFRIKIQYLWQTEPASDDKDPKESGFIWARYGQMVASSGFGTYLLPHPGDEVIVVGDKELPVVVASVFNSQNTPFTPTTTLDKPDVETFSIKRAQVAQSGGAGGNSPPPTPAEVTMFQDKNKKENILLNADIISATATEAFFVTTNEFQVLIPDKVSVRADSTKLSVTMMDDSYSILFNYDNTSPKNKTNTSANKDYSYTFAADLTFAGQGFKHTMKTYTITCSGAFTGDLKGDVKFKNLTM